jgi:type I restriction enzyme, S subunit
MMSVNKLTGWDSLPFTEALAELRIPKPSKVLARDYKPKGAIPIVDQGQRLIAGWTDDATLAIRDHLPLVIFGDHTRTFKFVDFPFAIGADGTQLLKPKEDFNPRFFYYGCLHLSLPNRGYNRHFGLLKEQVFPKPPKPAQEKIAAVLLKAEDALGVEDELIATAQEIKKSAIRHLFSRGLRRESLKETDIGQMPDSWDVRPLEEVREFLQYGTSAKCDYHGKGNPVIRIPNVVNGNVMATDLKWCELSDREVTSLLLESGDVLFIRTNGVRERVGTCAVYYDQPERALFASYLIRARLKQDELNPQFLQYFSMTAAGAAQLAGHASPAADGKFNVNMKTIDSVRVPVPMPEEQREIVGILETLDREIAVHESKRMTAREIFKTLLHQLMTCQIRIEELDIDTSRVTGTDGETIDQRLIKRRS